MIKIKNLFIFPIKLYRRFISPLKRGPSCRFVPSCSQYAVEAIDEWGIFIGLLLSVWRLLRCNPFCRGGFDPVPKKNRRNEEEGSND